jgi:hypothetical protein
MGFEEVACELTSLRANMKRTFAAEIQADKEERATKKRNKENVDNGKSIYLNER